MRTINDDPSNIEIKHAKDISKYLATFINHNQDFITKELGEKERNILNKGWISTNTKNKTIIPNQEQLIVMYKLINKYIDTQKLDKLTELFNILKHIDYSTEIQMKRRMSVQLLINMLYNLNYVDIINEQSKKYVSDMRAYVLNINIKKLPRIIPYDYMERENPNQSKKNPQTTDQQITLEQLHQKPFPTPITVPPQTNTMMGGTFVPVERSEATDTKTNMSDEVKEKIQPYLTAITKSLTDRNAAGVVFASIQFMEFLKKSYPDQNIHEINEILTQAKNDSVQYNSSDYELFDSKLETLKVTYAGQINDQEFNQEQANSNIKTLSNAQLGLRYFTQISKSNETTINYGDTSHLNHRIELTSNVLSLSFINRINNYNTTKDYITTKTKDHIVKKAIASFNETQSQDVHTRINSLNTILDTLEKENMTQEKLIHPWRYYFKTWFSETDRLGSTGRLGKLTKEFKQELADVQQAANNYNTSSSSGRSPTNQ